MHRHFVHLSSSLRFPIAVVSLDCPSLAITRKDSNLISSDAKHPRGLLGTIPVTCLHDDCRDFIPARARAGRAETGTISVFNFGYYMKRERERDDTSQQLSRVCHELLSCIALLYFIEIKIELHSFKRNC